jgi:hypothetical protein
MLVGSDCNNNMLGHATGAKKGADSRCMEARVEQEALGFAFDTFAAAWEALAGVTTAHLTPERQQEAKEAVMAAMYPQGDGARHFRNTTQFILGRVA